MFLLRFWKFRSRNTASDRRANHEEYEDRTSIARSISRLAAENQHHGSEEVKFWRKQLHAAWWLNYTTLIAALIPIGTVDVLIGTLIDARKATVEANRAWVAPRSAYLRRAFVLNDHPAFRVTYGNIGREPALNTTTWWRVSIADTDLR